MLSELIQKTIEALKNHGFVAEFFEEREDLCDRITKIVGCNASVAIPGTVTVRELGLNTLLKNKGCKVIDRWNGDAKTPEEKKKEILQTLDADFFLTSANAVIATGEIFNIDGVGNRVAGMSWSNGDIIYIVGVNKIVPALQEAFERLKNIACPKNAKRLNMQTPCALTGHCADCNSPQRFCRVSQLIHRAPMDRKAYVFIMKEDLGY
ncbi:MAG: lactate utilization protein [Synergistaceae bacterium]|nr:lactate utilization protein [Synergistaceae bacterium]